MSYTPVSSGAVAPFPGPFTCLPFGSFSPPLEVSSLSKIGRLRPSSLPLGPSKLNNVSSFLPLICNGFLRCLTLDFANTSVFALLHRKEVIQPHLPIRLPCYDFTPVANPTFGSALLAVRLLTSGITGSHGVTGGVYKARERIHRGMLIRDY